MFTAIDIVNLDSSIKNLKFLFDSFIETQKEITQEFIRVEYFLSHFKDSPQNEEDLPL